MKRRVVVFVVTVLAFGLGVRAAQTQPPPAGKVAEGAQAEKAGDKAAAPVFGKVVERCVDAFLRSTEARGLVVGVLKDRKREVYAYGDAGKGVERPLGGDTIFEIGSITKVFGGVLLAQMVEAGDVALEDPVSKLLPKGTVVPRSEEREITLLDLVTHTSSLPRLPDNLAPGDDRDPYVDYGAKQLYEFLARYQPVVPIGSKYDYSNLGAGLLGHALACSAGKPWPKLAQERVIAPLGLADTTTALNDEQRARLAQGHYRGGARARRWHFDALAAAGALCSTANDMLAFAAACLHGAKPPLAAALARSQKPLHTAGLRLKLGFGWHLSPLEREADGLVWHNGRTAGYASMLMLATKHKAAVVVLCNQSVSVDSLAARLIREVSGE